VKPKYEAEHLATSLQRSNQGMAGEARWFVVRDQAEVDAPIERCFALSTHLAVVQLTLAMRPVSGRLIGPVSGGDTVGWRGWKWGLPHTHESLIERLNPPVFFRDRMIAGRFAAFEHDHHFTQQQDGSVLLQDELRFRMKWGSAGAMLAHSVIMPHIRKLMRERFGLIKRLAEGEEWRTYID
jgi:ligand-binding SRPBCC domain-containing protein